MPLEDQGIRAWLAERLNLREHFHRTPIGELKRMDHGKATQMKRTLGVMSLCALGLANIIGSGIFGVTGTIAGHVAGPGIVFSILLASIGIFCVAQCYSEVQGMVSVTGTAVTYARLIGGRLPGWMLGWDLKLEYALTQSAVAVIWADHAQPVFSDMRTYLLPAAFTGVWWAWGAMAAGALLMFVLPDWLPGKPSRYLSVALGVLASMSGMAILPHNLWGFNLPAMLIIFMISVPLMKGIEETEEVNNWLVAMKLSVVALFLFLCARHVAWENFSPMLPYGWSGVLDGSSEFVYCFLGFETIGLLTEYSRDPQRDVPRATMGAVLLSVILYLAMSVVMVGCVSYKVLGNGHLEAAPMVKVLQAVGHAWAAPWVALGAVLAMKSVLLANSAGLSQLSARMSSDGYLPEKFGALHPKTGTPVNAIMFWSLVSAVVAGKLSIKELVTLVNIGTLFAFVVVCIAVPWLRHTEPERPRSYYCWGYPVVPFLGAGISFFMMCRLPWITWARFGGWMALGLVIYFAYSFRRSKEVEEERKSQE